MRGQRRGVAGLGLADLLEQRGAQALHQLRGDDVGRFRGAADPLPQMIEVELFGDASVMTIWPGREEFSAIRCVRRWRARRHSAAARRRRSRPARHSSPCPFGVSTSMRRRCGWTARSAMVLTSAKAMSASASRFSSSSRVIVAKLSPTVLSVSCAVAHALDHVGEAGIVRQVRLVQHVGAELLPFALALDRDQDSLAVLRAEHAVGRDRGMRQRPSASADCRLPN